MADPLAVLDQETMIGWNDLSAAYSFDQGPAGYGVA